jgi:hypothetical protein
LKKTVDYFGVSREAGENWLVRKTGAYLPRVNEKFIGYIKGLIITENNVLLLEAVSSFKDVYGIQRRAGERWIITPEMVDYNYYFTYDLDSYSCFGHLRKSCRKTENNIFKPTPILCNFVLLT